MTSEPSQHGWQPADRYEPTDEAPNQRGFGLFDAPAAPDEFPVFTPYNGSARESDAQFPPDSEMASSAPSFGGFPSEDLPPASEWASSLSEQYVSDQYVPAPAVVPIPGVRHDPELASPSWSTSSNYDLDPYPAPAAELDREEPSNGGASWAAFAAGDSPKAPSSSGGAWSEPSAPSWEDHPLNEQRREEPSRHEPAWGDSSYGTAEPDIAQPVSPAFGSARVSAAAPIQHRPEPTPEIPPISAPRPAGRVYGSAAVAAPQSDPVADPAPYAPPPPAPAPVPAALPVPGAPPIPGAPPARATARATVNVAKPNPGEAPPPQITRSSTVYGSAAVGAPAGPVSPAAPAPMSPAPMSPAQMGAAPVITPPGHAAPPRQGRQHAFGDLLGPAGAAAEAPPMMPPNAPAAAPIPGQRGPGGPGGPGMPPHGAPPPPNMGQPGMPPAAAQRASASVPANREPSQASFDQFKPATDTPAPAEPKSDRKGGIIIGVLVGCVALLAIAFGGLFLVDKIFNGPSFSVGDCVKQSEKVAVRADCGETGAFQVKAAVTSPEQCQDQSQPHVQQKDQILCLAPVAAAEVTATPSTAATPNQ